MALVVSGYVCHVCDDFYENATDAAICCSNPYQAYLCQTCERVYPHYHEAECCCSDLEDR